MTQKVFNPKDFLGLAQRLLSSTFKEREATLRTAISRAYYSCFLVCKQIAINNGEIWLKDYDKEDFPRPGEIHQAVRDALFNLSLGDVASKLYSLFEKRVNADYKIFETIVDKDVHEAIKIALDIENLVSAYE